MYCEREEMRNQEQQMKLKTVKKALWFPWLWATNEMERARITANKKPAYRMKENNLNKNKKKQPRQ